SFGETSTAGPALLSTLTLAQLRRLFATKLFGRSNRIFRHRYRSAQQSALLDKQHRRSNIALHSRGFIDLDSRLAVYVSVHDSADDAYAYVDVSLNIARLFDHKRAAFRSHLARYLAAHLKSIGEENVTRNLDSTTY